MIALDGGLKLPIPRFHTGDKIAVLALGQRQAAREVVVGTLVLGDKGLVGVQLGGEGLADTVELFGKDMRLR